MSVDLSVTPLQARNRVGRAVRHGDREAERRAREDLHAAKIAKAVREAAAALPPLRPEQRDALVVLLRGGDPR